MTMWPRKSYEVPIQTVQVAQASFPKGCLAMRIRDALGEVFSDGQFADLFAMRGHPSLSPARLAMAAVLQFTEGLTDRQAADAVRARLDWKYCLGLELTDPGFDASVLSDFRSRLVRGDAGARLLAMMLQVLRERQLLGGGGRHRTDATHVLAAIRAVNRLELVVETMRAALEALAVAAPDWLAGWLPEPWWDRYGQRASDFRLPKSDSGRDALAQTVGGDGHLLWEAVHAPQAPWWLRQLPAVQMLRQVWVQQYHRDEHGTHWRDKGDLPPGAVAIKSPYDRDARYAIKRGMGWSGYKAHFTETCEPDRPHLLVHVATTEATTADVETVSARHADLAAADLLPEEELVDGGYTSIGGILKAKDEYSITLTGPLPAESGWQAHHLDAFDLGHFTINWEKRQVLRGQTTGVGWRPSAGTVCRSSRWPSAGRTAPPAPCGPSAPAPRSTLAA